MDFKDVIKQLGVCTVKNDSSNTNRGSNKKYNSTNNDININSLHSETQNVLKIELQNGVS